MTAFKMNLDWAFAAPLQPHQQRLIRRLKPDVARWSQVTFNKLHARLQRADKTTQSVTGTRVIRLEGVWMFNVMIHNRDIGTDVVAMVAHSEEAIEAMRKCFMQAAQERMGAPVAYGDLEDGLRGDE